MTPEIERLIQELGNEVLNVCQCEPESVAMYAEVEDGVVSCNVFFVPTQSSEKALFRFGGERVSSLTYSLWEEWKAQQNSAEWRALVYEIRGGKLGIRPIYTDQFKNDQSKNNRRLEAVAGVLGGRDVDYSAS